MFYDRLKIACEKANTSVTATLKAIGIGTANGTYWKNGSIPSSDVIVKLAEFLDVSTDYLLLGKEHIRAEHFSEEQELINDYNSVDIVAKAMIRERARTLAELAAEQKENKYKKRLEATGSYSNNASVELPLGNIDDTIEINYYDMPSSAGTGSFLDHTQYERTQIKRTPEAERADFAIPIVGDSMEPDFHSGDVVLVKSCPYVHKGEIGIFVLDGEAYIKQYDGDRLVSLNKKYPPLNLSNFETAVCLGRVLGIAEPV